MKWFAIGGDLRYAYLVRAASTLGIDAGAIALENAHVPNIRSAPLDALNEADCVVIPNPFDDGLKTPLSDQSISLFDIFERIPLGTQLFLFGSGGVPGDMYARYQLFDLLRDEALLSDLARQTAEGAIQSITAKRTRELYNEEILIVGYGRIGRALTRMLGAFGARVTVAARREPSRALARQEGAQAIDMEELPVALPRSGIILSTPPERVLGARLIDGIAKDALLLDLSSAPYGVDVDLARKRGITAWRAPGLPGRYCPESAGEAMLQSILRLRKGCVV